MSRNRSKYVHDPHCLSLTHDGDCDCPRPRTPRVTASLPDRLRKAADELESLRCAEDAALMREAAEALSAVRRVAPISMSEARVVRDHGGRWPGPARLA